MKKFTPFLSILILFSASIFAQKSAKDFLISGYIKFDSKDHEGAIKDYDAAIQLNPNSAEAYFRRANAKLKLQQHKEVISD